MTTPPGGKLRPCPHVNRPDTFLPNISHLFAPICAIPWEASWQDLFLSLSVASVSLYKAPLLKRRPIPPLAMSMACLGVRWGVFVYV